MAFNSDGYIMVDFIDVDFRYTNQIIKGIYDRVHSVVGTNKFVLVINANHKTPLPSSVSFTNGKYVIESCIYSFAISTNDNIFIKRHDVPVSDIINDDIIDGSYTWSSYKINDELNNIDNIIDSLYPVTQISNASVANFTTSLTKPLKECIVNIPVTQTGSGTPSPTNIRDFVGVSQAVIGQTSGYGEYFRGLLNGTYGFVDLGSLDWAYYSSGTTFYVQIPTARNALGRDGFIQTTDYTSPVRGSASMGNNYDNVIAFGANNDYLYLADHDYTNSALLKASLSGNYLIFPLATPTTPTITDAQFETLCEAFGITGNTYQISFGQTVYSAIIDVLTGKLFATHEIKTIDDNSGITRATTNVFYLSDFFDVENDTDSINCNIYERGENKSTGGDVVSNPDYSFCCRTTSNQLYIKDVRYNTITDYNDYLANNPVKIAVKLAEPIEVQLTPVQIITLMGTNNIFSNIGTVTISFMQSIQEYIDSKINT